MDTKDNTFNKKKTIGCLFAVILVAIIAISVWFYNPCRAMDKYLENNDYAKAVETFNERIKGLDYEGEYAELLLAEIEEVVLSWSEDKVSYENAAILLEEISKVKNEEISSKALENKKMVLIEGQGEQYHLEAEASYEAGEFIEAMKAVKTINKDYSKLDEAEELYIRCKNLIIEDTSSQTSEEEYESDISYLEECLDIVYDQELQKHKQHLEHELYVYRESVKIIEKAEAFYAKGEYKEVFTVLDTGISKYPESTQLAEAKNLFHQSYVGSIAMEIKASCEVKDFRKANEILKMAMEEYNCDEFILLRESIREQQFIGYKFIKDIGEFVTKVYKGELDVAKATKETGEYILKSGEKLLLGDYSDEEVTVLSLNAGFWASLYNFDIGLDIRDLVYDIQHIGEEEYIVARLAVDVIALVPVVGMVKCLRYADDIADGVKTTTNVIEQIAESSKTAEQMADAVKATKSLDNLGEALDTVTDIGKTVNKTEAISGTVKKYPHKTTINEEFKDKIHEGVLYASKNLNYSTDEFFEAVFPVFKSKYDFILEPKNFLSTSTVHKKKAMEALQEALENDKSLNKQFTRKQLKQIKKGKLPKDLVWHHSEEEGLLQLVDRAIHEKAKHTGGMSLWGRGYKK